MASGRLFRPLLNRVSRQDGRRDHHRLSSRHRSTPRAAAPLAPRRTKQPSGRHTESRATPPACTRPGSNVPRRHPMHVTLRRERLTGATDLVIEQARSDRIITDRLDLDFNAHRVELAHGEQGIVLYAGQTTAAPATRTKHHALPVGHIPAFGDDRPLPPWPITWPRTATPFTSESNAPTTPNSSSTPARENLAPLPQRRALSPAIRTRSDRDPGHPGPRAQHGATGEQDHGLATQT